MYNSMISWDHDYTSLSKMWQPPHLQKWAYPSRGPEIPLPHLRLLWNVGDTGRPSRRVRGPRQAVVSGTDVPTRHRPDRGREPQYRQRPAQKNVIRPLAETIRPLRERPILELDELWSYVGSKANKVWIWPALERQTRRIVGLAFGDRSDVTCRAMWQSLPPDYRKRALLYSDYWESYANVLPAKRLHQVDKDSGETAHIERFNNTLRQRCANLVRKTLSFSKDLKEHERRIRLFIDHYNATLSV
jgi:insertion element IS1 protein InsB